MGREIKIHYPTFSLFKQTKEEKKFSARLDLLFVFTLDINPGRELTERKRAELGDVSEAFDYLIYSFLRPTVKEHGASL